MNFSDESDIGELTIR